MDGPTDGPTDTPSYRDARTHLTRPIGPMLRPWQLVVGVGWLAVVAAVVVVAWVVAVTLAVIMVFLRTIRRVNIGFSASKNEIFGKTFVFQKLLKDTI